MPGLADPTPSSLQHWRLTPWVHGVAIGDDLVLLDVAADAYFCLVGGALTLRLGEDGAVAFADAATAEDLRAAGLVTRRAAVRPAARLPPPEADLAEGASSPADGRAWRALIGSSLSAHLDLGRLGFSRLLDVAADRPDSEDRRLRDPSPDLAVEAVRLQRLRVWAPFDGACLARSYMALKYLRTLGHDAALVIGVRTWPFAAHCWLQSGAVVLDDTLEHVRPYHPILVV
jgi:hypothetical protein